MELKRPRRARSVGQKGFWDWGPVDLYFCFVAVDEMVRVQAIGEDSVVHPDQRRLGTIIAEEDINATFVDHVAISPQDFLL